MTFPATILDRVVQAFINGAWEVVTPYVYQRDPMRITRGAGAERSQTQPVRCELTLDDRDGRWSPRYVDGTWFGSVGRNLLIAVGCRVGESYLVLGGSVANYITTPDSAGTSVTGDIDVRIDVTLEYWRGVRTDLAGKYGAAGQRSWGLELVADGTIRFTWSADGTAIVQVASTIPVPWPQRNRVTLRATLDVNNGAGGYTVTFYYSTDQGTSGEWTQLGDAVVTTAGTTSIFNSTAATVFGAVNSTSSGVQAGRLHAGAVLSGIAGTIVADPDVRPEARLTTSFSDGTNTWTVTGSGAAITNYRNEFVGEIPDLTAQRDKSGEDVFVPVVASGITRRLGQGATPVQSTLRRAIPSIGAALHAYWPLEDGANSTFAASGLPGVGPMRWVTASPSFGSYDGFDGSAPLPTLNGSSPRGVCPIYTSTGDIQVRCLLAVPSTGATNNAVILRVTCNGTAPRWDVIYTTGGALTVKGYDSTGTLLGTLGPFAFAVDGTPLMMQLELSQNGSGVDVTLSTVEPGQSTGGTATTTVASSTVTIARAVQLNPGGLLTDTAAGHVTVEDTITSLFALGSPLAGWIGETAGNRIERLCGEEGITFRPLGDLDDSAAMGPQGRDTLLGLLRECETTDGGILSEPRDRLGITYKPRTALYSPGTALTLDGGGGTGGDLLDYAHTDDDQLTRNDITVSRPGGSSARAVDTTGPLGVDTVGLYDDAVTANIRRDEDLEDQASWRLNLGTIDEPRFPLVEVELARSPLVADSTTTTAVIETDLGDGLTIADPPSPLTLPRTDVREIVVGRVVELGSNTYTARFVCQPAAGYDVMTFDYEHPGEESRLSSDGSTVNGAHSDPADTTLSVATPTGPVWGHGDGDFTIYIPETGERMTVTGITGTSTPQTFDVVRGVDGTTAKALSGGETVELARPVRWGL